jgi:hypothetical protein
VRLASCQSACITAKKRKMRSEFLAKRHELRLSLEKTCRVFGDALELLQPWKDRPLPSVSAPQRC